MLEQVVFETVLEYKVLAYRLFLAIILGSIIGIERERLNKSAGLRTHILVCVGSCLIMLVSLTIYYSFPNTNADPGRIAAQVVSGIGFLGAGTIMRSGAGVKGLTTAATLWVVAGIGLAVGVGAYFIAVLTTVVVFLILSYLFKFEGYLSKSKNIRNLFLVVDDRPGQIGLVCSALGDMEISIRNIELSEPSTDNTVKVNIEIKTPYTINGDELLEVINKLEGVHKAMI